MVNSNIDNSRNSKHDCLDCENYRRKFKEAEQTLSGRDVLIDMLQKEIKKVEELYKKSIDDYEKLRFLHCTTVQELSNLKEIHKKLEEYSNKLSKEKELDKRQLEKLQSEVENWKNQYEELQHAEGPRKVQNVSKTDEERSLHESIVQEVSHIESIIQNQNDSIKVILLKVLDEIKNIKNPYLMENSPLAPTQSDGDSKDKQIDELNQFVAKLKSENEAIKSQLTEKKTKLCNCLCALENNHSSIANLSGNIEMLVSEKERYLEEITNLKNIIEASNNQLKKKDQEVCEMKCAVEQAVEDNTKKLQDENVELKKELKECKEYIEHAGHAVEEKGKKLKFENMELKKELKQNMEQVVLTEGIIKKLQDENTKLKQELKESRHSIEQGSQVKNDLKEPQEENVKLKKELKECKENIEHMKDTIDKANYAEQNMRKVLDQNEELKKDLNNCRQAIEMQRKEHLEKEQTLNSEKRRLMEKMKEMEEHTCVLGDTLEIVIDENKSNLQKIPDLNKKLNEVNKEMEECKCKLRTKITDLERETEEYKARVKVLEDTLAKERETRESNKNKECDEEVNKLIFKVKTVEHQLEEKSLENVEYEEENKYYCQKIESLLADIDTLEREKLRIHGDNVQKDKQIRQLQEEINALKQLKTSDLEQLREQIREIEGDNARKESEIIQMKDEINTLRQEDASKLNVENEELRQKIKKIEGQHAQKQNEIIQLKDDITAMKKKRGNKYEMENDDLREKISWMEAKLIRTIEENARVDLENQEVHSHVKHLQKEISDIQAVSESKILLLQDKIQGLEKHEVDREREIADCCNQVDNIKKCFTERGENPVQTAQQEDKEKEHLLEKIDSLKKKIAKYQEMTEECDCNSMVYQGRIMELEATIDRLEKEVESMEGEMCQRQCQIRHLEQCVDKGNKILAECEKQLKDLHCENEVLKTENETFKTNLEKYVYEAQVTKAENQTLQEKLTQLRHKMQDLESNKSENLQQRLSATDEAAKITQKYNLLMQKLQEKDEELKKAQKTIEGLKKTSDTNLADYEKLRKAYREIKDLLLQEIEKYNRDKLDQEEHVVDVDCKTECKMEVKARACLDKYIKDMELDVVKKENIIKTQQHQIDDLTYDISQLKEYVHKVVSDNKSLKNAINNLLQTLVGKLKDFNTDVISNPSSEFIVHEILSSLVAMEKQIKHTELPTDRCNCMSVIMSTYNIQKDDPILQNLVACNLKCHKRITDLAKYENVNVGSSSEVLNICEDCCGESPFREKSGEDDLSLFAKWVDVDHRECDSHEHQPRKTDPDATDEPFVIEPDTEYADG